MLQPLGVIVDFVQHERNIATSPIERKLDINVDIVFAVVALGPLHRGHGRCHDAVWIRCLDGHEGIMTLEQQSWRIVSVSDLVRDVVGLQNDADD